MASQSYSLNSLMIRSLEFSIKDKDSNDVSDGTLSNLLESSNNNKTSSITVQPELTSNGTSVLMAVYTPPDFLNYLDGIHKTIIVMITDPTDPSTSLAKIPIQIYRPPVVLVHGLWENPKTWVDSTFKQALVQKGLNVTLANYTAHNADTFDP